MTPKEQAEYYLDQIKYQQEDYAARDVIQSLLNELESIEATTGSLKVCHSLRGAVMSARKQAAEHCAQIADDYHQRDPVHFVANAISGTIRKKFGLEI